MIHFYSTFPHHFTSPAHYKCKTYSGGQLLMALLLPTSPTKCGFSQQLPHLTHIAKPTKLYMRKINRESPSALKMSVFVPKKAICGKFCFITEAQTDLTLVKAFGEHHEHHLWPLLQLTQNWWRLCGRQGQRKTTENFWSCKVVSVVGRRLHSNHTIWPNNR